MKVLGVHLGHDSAAALVVDGAVVAHSAEERFARVKHYGGFPIRSVRHCLDTAGISMDDVDAIASTVSLRHPSLEVLFTLSEKDVRLATKGDWKSRFSREAVERMLRKRIRMPQIPPAYLEMFRKNPRTELVRVDHHHGHGASAYYTSGYDECLVIAADGIGDETATSVWRASGGHMQVLRRFGAGGSFGWFYSLVTEGLGWQVTDGEGKTMGLAPYGDPHAFDDALLAPLLPKYVNGELADPADFGAIANVRILDTDNYHFVRVPEVRELIECYGREAVAAKAQYLLEEQMIDFIQHWVKREGASRLAAAGGVFLNVKVNQEVVERGIVEDYHIFPDAGDAGLPVGAALAIWQERTGRTTPLAPITDVYWGPSFTAKEIEDTLRNRNLRYHRSTDVARETAEFLAQGKIVGWFQGRGESGPRALGGRSILMDPRRAENKDIINARVKYREAFRPFCPSMTAEAARMYLTQTYRDRYMICASSVTPQAVRDIPAVVHVDNTVRPQVVGPENPRYLALLEHFGRLTGVPALLNTSFNIRGEAIVSTPSEAIRCFFDTGMDVLAIDEFLVAKR